MTENIEKRTDDSLDPANATLRGALGDDLGGTGGSDDGVPVGDADVDADRARTGADQDDSGGGPASSLFGADRDGDRQTDGGVPVGSADRHADADRSR